MIQDEEMFIKRIKSIKAKAINGNHTVLLKFLDERQQELIKQIIGKDLFLYFSGGYKSSEYKRCFISSNQADYIDFSIVLLKVDYNKKYLTVNHRMILGALMSLGISRDVIGDIIINDDNVYIVCSKEISTYLIEQFKVLKSVPVSLIVSGDKVESKTTYEVKKCFVSSLRLDVIISEMYNLSRQLSSDIIKKELVKVNHKMINNISHLVKEDDLISVKGYGRMKVLENIGFSKSNKIIINLALIK